MMRSPLLHWLSLRVRIICVAVIAVSGFIPPYTSGDTISIPETEVDLPQVLLVEDGFLMKSSSLTQRGTRRAYTRGIVHIVEDGDSLARIAKKYDVSVDTVRWVNDLDENEVLKPKQELVILPVDGVLHTVSRGQTLGRIAELYDIEPDRIREQNSLKGDFIVSGQELIIPDGKPIVAKRVQVATKPKTPGVPKASTKPTPTAVPYVPTNGVLQMPCSNCFYTQKFHAGHYAVDLQTRGGGPIFAAEGGTVTRADYGWNGGFGNVIIVDHGNGLETLYAHNKELYVGVGDAVTRGQKIAFMGRTGRVYGPTGIHVHFEVRVNGHKKNPILYLQ